MPYTFDRQIFHHTVRTPLLLCAIAFLSLLSCHESGTPGRSSSQEIASLPPRSLFDSFLDAPFPPADGFDFPFGDGSGGGGYVDQSTGTKYSGWQIATGFAESYSMGLHTGEDWNGSGGGNTDLGAEVRSIANGRVVFAANCGKYWGNVIIIEHIYYENNSRRTIRSLYAHLHEIAVKKSQLVKRRQLIGSIGQDPDKLFKAHLHLELRRDTTLSPTYWPSSNGRDAAWIREHYSEPSPFIRSHRTLPVPQKESTLLLVDKTSYRMRLYRGGKKSGEYDVSFGQSKGVKREKGDNKTPEGMYFVIEKQRGKFDGEYGAYFGGHWIKFNYPNRYDAALGVERGAISPAQAKEIAANWVQRKGTLEGTSLGGGVGFHGWATEWSNDGPRHLSWGCVVMHIRDIKKLYDLIPAGTMVVIF